ncbi:RES domain protein [compost metagenome]
MDFEADELHICHQCVGDRFLTAEIAQSDVAVCSYCDQARPCWSMQTLADRVELAFAEHFTRTSSEPYDWQYALIADKESDYDWERDGEEVLFVIEEAARIPQEAASDALELLGAKYYDHDSAQMGEETEFDSHSHYERKGSSSWELDFKWAKFEESLQSQSRFFSRHAAAHLSSVFNGIDQLNTWEQAPLVIDAGPGTTIEELYRARVFQSREALKPALGRPDRELGSPPGRFAASGRMNARGISVFYGATAQSIALAEVRPPVGSDVAVAAFKIIRPLRLLDLSALERTHIDGSVFDPTLSQRLDHVAFLRTLGKKMTRPVMPADQEFDYLATQAVADFLATENTPALDGIVFESTQAEGGKNVVLFHKASRVRDMDLSAHVERTVTTEGYDEDGPYPDYHVHSVVMPRKEGQDLRPLGEVLWDLDVEADPSDPAPTSYTLEVIPDSVEVHHVEQVEVKCTVFKVTCSTSEPREGEKF